MSERGGYLGRFSRATVARAVLLVSLVHGLVYASLIPPWQAPDEPAHLEYVRLIYERGYPTNVATLNLLPEIVSAINNSGFYQYVPWATPLSVAQGDESYQPPGYYLAVMPWFVLLPTNDVLGQLARARMASVLMTVGIVALVIVSTRQLFPDSPGMQFMVPAGVALFPMFIHIGAAVNNDNLANLIAAFEFTQIGAILKKGASTGRGVSLGGAVVAGYLTKRTITALAPLVGLAILLALYLRPPALSGKGRAAALLAGGAGGLSLILAWRLGWLSGLLEEVYHNTAFTTFVIDPFEIARRIGPSLLPVETFLFRTFWGSYGWTVVELGDWAYDLLALLCLAILIGLGLAVYRFWHGRLWPARWQVATLLVYALGVVLLIAGAFLGYGVFLVDPAYAQYQNRLPQGRYLFPAMLPLATLAVVGVRALLPVKSELKLAVLLTGSSLTFAALSLALVVVPYFGH